MELLVGFDIKLPKEVVAALKAEGYWGEGAVDIRAYEEEHSDWTYLTDKYAHSVVKF